MVGRLNTDEKFILNTVFSFHLEKGTFPSIDRFRVDYRQKRDVIDMAIESLISWCAVIVGMYNCLHLRETHR